MRILGNPGLLLSACASGLLLLVLSACSTGGTLPAGRVEGLAASGNAAAVLPSAGGLGLPEPRALYRQAAILPTTRHLPAVQCETMHLGATNVIFNPHEYKAVFTPTGDGLGGAAYLILPFSIADLEDDGYPDLRFFLDGTRSEDDGTLRCFVGVADYGRNNWEWEEYETSNGRHFPTVPTKKSPAGQLIVCVVFFGGGVFDAVSFDLRPDGVRWPAEELASWETPDTTETHSGPRWAKDPYVEDVLRCFWIDTSTDTLMNAVAGPDTVLANAVTQPPQMARSFSTAAFGDGSVRVAYFDAAAFKLRVLHGDGSYSPDSWSPEYSLDAGGGTPLLSSSVTLLEEPATHTPRLVFHDEALGGLRFAEPGALPGELAVSIISDAAAVGRKQKMWLMSNFRCVATDDTPGATGIIQFDFDAAMGWIPTKYDLSTMPFMPPGAMDALSLSPESTFAAYTCPHGTGMCQWTPDTKSGSKVASKTFVMPHVFETKGGCNVVAMDSDAAGEPCVLSYYPSTREVGLAQYDTAGGDWFTEVVCQLDPDEDCDGLDLYLDDDDDGDGFCDAAVLLATKQPAAASSNIHWRLEVRVDRIEMK